MSDYLYIPEEKKITKSNMFKFYLKYYPDFKKLQWRYKDPSSLISNFEKMHNWSVDNTFYFWKSLILHYNVIFEGDIDKSEKEFKNSFSDYTWFSDLKINFAENLIFRHKKDNKTAVVSFNEFGQKRDLSYKDVYKNVKNIQKVFNRYIDQESIVAAYMPNVIETLEVMLGATSLGSSFTSTSCDFGHKGVVDRFSQSKPKVLVTCLNYFYQTKKIDLINNIVEIVKGIQKNLKVLVITNPFLAHDFKSNLDILKKKLNENEIKIDIFVYDEIIYQTQKVLTQGEIDEDFKVVRVPFDHPLYIMYSSGTTGKPKCIVHSVGGTLLQHIKELGLHCNLNEKKKIFYFTTCGWMMWNWLVSSLFFKSDVLLYEGSPSFPSLFEFLQKVDNLGVNIWGTSPKFLQTIENQKTEIPPFENLETILSTGAPLLKEQYDYVYHKIKSNVLLGSISGGTDIIGCFMLANTILPVKTGKIQCKGLAMDVDCFNELGESLTNEQGELVCKQSFPSQPVYFLNDPDQSKYFSSYFTKYKNTWNHGDYISIDNENMVEVFGRSDATLNPGGVRIGTAEIYRQVESMSEVDDSICIGYEFNGDVNIILFVKLINRSEFLDEELIKKIKSHIRTHTSPRHVPWKVFKVEQIPYTKSGKKMELLVHRIFKGIEVTNLIACSNPECLESFNIIKESLSENE